ncbi:hypothetical protein GF361_03100 [Candidatus Woesearchaeota archaeon]|nr:hypothetical protein [Candidatus Woesearchaeota archaeon]
MGISEKIYEKTKMGLDEIVFLGCTSLAVMGEGAVNGYCAANGIEGVGENIRNNLAVFYGGLFGFGGILLGFAMNDPHPVAKLGYTEKIPRDWKKILWESSGYGIGFAGAGASFIGLENIIGYGLGYIAGKMF